MMTPVGGVGGMVGQCKGIEAYIVRMGIFGKGLARLATFGRLVLEPCIEFFQQPTGAGCYLAGSGIVAGTGFNSRQSIIVTTIHGLAPFLVIEQIITQIDITFDHPQIAQNLEQHPRRATGAALRAQHVQIIPGSLTQKPDDNLTIGIGRIIVGYFANIFWQKVLHHHCAYRWRSIVSISDE